MKCWKLNSRTVLGAVKPGKRGREIKFENLPQALQLMFTDKLASINLHYDDQSTLWKFDELVKDNVKYANNDCFIIDLLHGEEIPLFVEVEHILFFKRMGFIRMLLPDYASNL